MPNWPVNGWLHVKTGKLKDWLLNTQGDEGLRRAGWHWLHFCHSPAVTHLLLAAGDILIMMVSLRLLSQMAGNAVLQMPA